jgi:hypothetical protein
MNGDAYGAGTGRFACIECAAEVWPEGCHHGGTSFHDADGELHWCTYPGAPPVFSEIVFAAPYE